MDDSLFHIIEIEAYMKSNTDHNYIVVEDKNKTNSVTEVYILKDEAEFEGM